MPIHRKQLIRKDAMPPTATISQQDKLKQEDVNITVVPVKSLVRHAMTFLKLSNNISIYSAEDIGQLHTFLQEVVTYVDAYIEKADSTNDKQLVLLILILLSGVCALNHRFDFKLNDDLIDLFKLLSDVFCRNGIVCPKELAEYMLSLRNSLPSQGENANFPDVDLIRLDNSLIENHAALKEDRMLRSFSIKFHTAIGIICGEQHDSSKARLQIISNSRKSGVVTLEERKSEKLKEENVVKFLRLSLAYNQLQHSCVSPGPLDPTMFASAYKLVVRSFSTGTNPQIGGISREGIAFFSAIHSSLSSLDSWGIRSIKKRCVELIEMERFPVEFLNKLRDCVLIWFFNKDYYNLLGGELPNLEVLFASMGQKETLSYFNAVMSRMNADIWDQFRVCCLYNKQAPLHISKAVLNLDYFQLSDRLSADQHGHIKFSQYLTMAIRVTTYLGRLGLSPPSPLQWLLTSSCPSSQSMFYTKLPFSPPLFPAIFISRQQKECLLALTDKEEARESREVIPAPRVNCV